MLSHILVVIAVFVLQLRTFPDGGNSLTYDDLVSGSFLHSVIQTL